MTYFDYAKSNSLLKNEIEEKSDDNDNGNGSCSSPEMTASSSTTTTTSVANANANVNANSAAMIASAYPVSAPAIAASSTVKIKTKNEKKIPSKKSSRTTKHKLTNGDANSDTTPTTTTTIASNATPNTAATVTANQQTTESTMEIGTTHNVAQNNNTNTTGTILIPSNKGGPDAAPAQDDDVTKKLPKRSRVRKPRRVISNEKKFIPVNEQPTQSDVVGGRGGRSNHHPGNRPYWIRILESRAEYTRSRSDHEKSKIANGILGYVQEDLKGQFLNIDSKTKRWYILPDSVVLDKIKQALRDKYIPYWARELKIENKKHNALHSSVQARKEAAAGDNALMHSAGIDSKSAHAAALNSLNATLQSYSAARNPHNLFDQAVTLAAINQSRANAANARAANALNLAAAATASAKAAADAATAAANKQNTMNKLDFLFGVSTRRPMGQTATIPTVDDILKCKVDQMPTFAGVSNAELMAAVKANAFAPPIHSIGLNPYQSNLPPTWMSSLGLGGLPGPRSLLNEAAHRGFGTSGNPGAPALPPAAFGMTSMGAMQSIGVLQALNMRSLDQFMEEKLAGGIPQSMGAHAFAPTAAVSLTSLGMMNGLAGSSIDSSASHASSAGLAAALAPAAAPPSGSKKTDWNAMYTRALTNSKTM